MIKIAINGCNGKMGQVVADIVATSFNDKACVSFGIDICENDNCAFPIYIGTENIPEDAKADVIIDFSNPAALKGLLDYSVKTNTPIVVATTGLSKDEEQMMHDASKQIPLFWSANMSLGICLLKELAKKAAAFLGENYDIEIVEKHHNRKLDAPSGTALAIADAINESQGDKFDYEYDRHSKRAKRKPTEIGIAAVRGGNIVGDHEVIFAGQNEVIEITHKAMSRSLFADGAVKAAFFLTDKPAGFYNMDNLLAE